MALAEHLLEQPAAGGDAEAVRSALPAAVEKATTHKKRPDHWCVRWVGEPGAVPIDEPAKRGRRAAPDPLDAWVEA